MVPPPGLPNLASSLYQVAWVVADIEAGARFLRDVMGCPSVYVAERAPFDELRLRGDLVDSVQHIALAYAGDTQLELIQPVEGQSLYTEFLETSGAGGLHHLGFAVEDTPAAGAALVAAGYPEVWSGRAGGTRFSYHDAGPSAGMAYVELFTPSPGTWKLFERIKAGEI